MALDLHIHSTFSDGTLKPDQLVSMAKAKGLKAISITDHDTVEGVSDALDAGREFGFEVIPGIELSAVYRDTHLHLLGYCVDHTRQELITALLDIQYARTERNSKIVQKLQSFGFDITVSEVEEKSMVGQAGRPHIAQVLLEKKIVRSIHESGGPGVGQT